MNSERTYKIEGATEVVRNGYSGFFTLFAVIVITVIGLSFMLTLVFLSTNSLISTKVNEDHSKSVSYADACAEFALNSLKDSLTYSGGTTITFENGECTVVGVSGTGNAARVIQTTGTSNTTLTRLVVEITIINPNINIARWEYISDF